MYKAQNLVHREAIVSVYTHARTHACMRARTHPHPHTHTHAHTIILYDYTKLSLQTTEKNGQQTERYT